MEKDAAGCPSLPSHYGLTNPGISRYLASRLPYFTCSSEGIATRSCGCSCYDWPQPGHNPVCDHWYPTKTCDRSNPVVRSSWDNVTSPTQGGRASRERARRLLAPRRSGAKVDGMANPGELLINVVRTSKPKALRGLNQKVSGPVQGCSPSPAAAVEPPANRQSLNHP